MDIREEKLLLKWTCRLINNFNIKGDFLLRNTRQLIKKFYCKLNRNEIKFLYPESSFSFLDYSDLQSVHKYLYQAFTLLHKICVN
jgi:hypothetical protein